MCHRDDEDLVNSVIVVVTMTLVEPEPSVSFKRPLVSFPSLPNVHDSQ